MKTAISCVVITVLIALPVTASFAQKEITARVVDYETKLPLKNAVVVVKNKSTSTTTNHLGYFQIALDSLDTLAVSLQGYNSLVFVAPGSDSFLVAMNKAPISIYKDGMVSFYTFLSENLNYPYGARTSNKGGYVYVQFQIDSRGSLTNLSTVKDIGGGCGKEVQRVLKKISKNFIPDPASTTYILPVQFRLDSDNAEYQKLDEQEITGVLLTEIVVTAIQVR